MNGGILTGIEILAEIQKGRIGIDPLNTAQINPASVDLRLGDELAWYKPGLLDAKVPNPVDRTKIQKEGFIFTPGRLYLAHTFERVCTQHYVPVLDGKSSIARLGVVIHLTAGYGDAGFDGQYTLEMMVLHPIRLYAGMRIAQIRFHTMVGLCSTYEKEGNYKGSLATGPVPSLSFKQFGE